LSTNNHFDIKEGKLQQPLGEPDFLDEKDVSPDICGDVSVGLLDVLKS